MHTLKHKLGNIVKGKLCRLLYSFPHSVSSFLKRREGIPHCEKSGEWASHVGGGSIPGEDGPGLPAHVVPVPLVHVLSQPIHIGAGQQEGQLQVLLRKHEGPDARVQPGPMEEERESPNQQAALSARTLPCILPEHSCFRSYHPRSCFWRRPF